jgi:hypothetical protein
MNGSVKLCVSWGNEDVVVELSVSADVWQKIRSGEQLVLKGRGYSYEGKRLQDTWEFNRDHEGSLTVSYGGGGDGYIGDWESAIQ